MVSREEKYINDIKEQKQSLELPQETIEKLVCRQLFHLDNTETLNLIRNFFNLKYYNNEDLKILHTIGVNYWKIYNKPPTTATIQTVLKNDKYKEKSEKLLNLKKQIDNLTDFDPKYVQDTILNFIKGRSVYYTILDNIDYITSTNDVSRIMPRLEDTMKISISDDIGIEYFENLNNHINEMTTKEVRIPFLWKTWDMYTYGGIPENDGCLFVIMAQPGLGKSQMMMNIGYNWLMQDKNVLMVSLEMSEKMYSARMDALFADICVNEIKDNTDKLAKRVKLMKSTHSNARLYIKQYSPNEFNSNKLKNLLDKLQKTKNFKPDLIVVDYLNIMGTNGPSYGMKSYDRIGMITKELRAVSVETKIPILSATQANRGNGGYSTDDSISMDNTSQSSAINMDADCLFALYQGKGDRQSGILHVKILKNRLGGFVDRNFIMMVDYNTLKITENEQGIENDLSDTIGDSFEQSVNGENNNKEVEEIFNNI